MAQAVFEVTTDFIDAGNVLNRTIRPVESLERLIARGADLLDHVLIGFIAGIHRQNALAGRVENHFSKWNPAQLSMFVEQPAY
ncbi:MAG: hypothetical protein DME65_00315 [Verrucomicrobia bacterium]|nr:MAG: hypothetical protein DME65_00315 [Verrucomicrobiota bacterium]